MPTVGWRDGKSKYLIWFAILEEIKESEGLTFLPSFPLNQQSDGNVKRIPH